MIIDSTHVERLAREAGGEEYGPRSWNISFKREALNKFAQSITAFLASTTPETGRVTEEEVEALLDAAARPKTYEWRHQMRRALEALRQLVAEAVKATDQSFDATVINGSSIAEFVASYQFDASDEGFVHTPTVNERAMIEDAICSFISDGERLRASTAPAGVTEEQTNASLRERLSAAYDKVATWPENRMAPDAVEKLGPGFMDLLELRNFVPETITALEAAAPRQPVETEAWTEERLREAAKRRGWHVRENASVPDLKDGGWKHPFSITASSCELLELLTAVTHPAPVGPAPAEVIHPDDLAVDRFAAAMKAKLAKKSEEGRGGWDGPTCSAEILSQMLRKHVEKGDPVDVANLSMMLHQRGEGISPDATLAGQSVTLAQQVLEFFKAARVEGLYVGAGKNRRLPDNEEAQYGPLAKALLANAKAIRSTLTHPAPVGPAPAEVKADYFSGLVDKARSAAAKASVKFPQPNYVTLKIAEEAGEVVRGAVHYAEGRMEWNEVEGEIVQLLAMLIRFVTEGDQINGVRPPALTKADKAGARDE